MQYIKVYFTAICTNLQAVHETKKPWNQWKLEIYDHQVVQENIKTVKHEASWPHFTEDTEKCEVWWPWNQKPLDQ